MLTLSAATLLLLSASPSPDFDRYEWTLFDMASHALPNDSVDDIAFDAKGTAWVTTNGLGLCRFDGNGWKTVRQPDMKTNGWLHHIEFLPDGRLFIVGLVGKIALYDPKTDTWEYRDTPKGVQFWTAARNAQGVMLLGTGLSGPLVGLFEYTQGEFKLLQEGSKDVFSILLKANGDALVSFREGTWAYPVTQDGRYLPQSGTQVSPLAFYSLQLDARGTLWGAGYTTSHLFSLQCGEWYEYRNLPPVLHVEYTGGTYVNYGLAVLADQRVIISTQFGSHLAVFNGSEWQAYTPPMQVAPGFGAIHLAPDGSVWVASQKGLLVFSDRANTKYPKYVPAQEPQPLAGFTREHPRLPAATTARCLDCPKCPDTAARPASRDSSARPARDSTH